jgi:hypothetical protein
VELGDLGVLELVAGSAASVGLHAGVSTSAAAVGLEWPAAQSGRGAGGEMQEQARAQGQGARGKKGRRLGMLDTDAIACSRRTLAESWRRPARLRSGPDGLRTGRRLGWGCGSDGLEGFKMWAGDEVEGGRADFGSWAVEKRRWAAVC